MSKAPSLSDFGQFARSAGVTAVYGVPDSLMRRHIDELEKEFSPNRFVIAANEGAAVGLAIGHHLATGGLPLVFMQNSGLGNSLNPLISLADQEVYSIPLVLMVGWRAEILESGTQKKDEPQHVKQGKVTLGQLKLLGIPHYLIAPDGDFLGILKAAAEEAVETSGPVALVVRSGTVAFRGEELQDTQARYPTREEIIAAVAQITGPNGQLGGVPVIATTGMISRELYENRLRTASASIGQDFLTVGGMGHAISIATSVAQDLTPHPVICLDGDGAALMHMGALLQAAQRHNLIHIILDNGVHDSVGGQPTGFRSVNVESLATSFSYTNYMRIETVRDFFSAFEATTVGSESTLIHAMCEPGHRHDLVRPATPPPDAKKQFMDLLASKRYAEH